MNVQNQVVLEYANCTQRPLVKAARKFNDRGVSRHEFQEGMMMATLSSAAYLARCIGVDEQKWLAIASSYYHEVE